MYEYDYFVVVNEFPYRARTLTDRSTEALAKKLRRGLRLTKFRRGPLA